MASMTDARLRIATAQLNPVVGDIQGNLTKAREAVEKAIDADCDLVAFPELYLIGYPPEDLILKPSAVADCMAAVDQLADAFAGKPIRILMGTPWQEDAGGRFNSAVLLHEGRVVFRYDKTELPNYGVFDEKRIFDQGETFDTFALKGARIGVAICEDIWLPNVPRRLADAGADLLVVPNGSPWRRDIISRREQAFAAWRETGLPFLFVNQIGGQDELAFDGASYGVNRAGERIQQLPDFEEAFSVTEWEQTSAGWDVVDGEMVPITQGLEAEYRAAVLALGDYVNKNRFPGVVLGLSGGIDSALTAAIAVDALGPDRVWCVMMPSRYTSEESLEDARACAEALGVRYDTISISPGVEATDAMLGDLFAETTSDTTEENIQSRLRGLTLMALSNKFGHMVVTTGNKSEMAVGYATLYGDMCGGYNALKDFYKTEVFMLSRWRNGQVPRGALGPAGEVIPQRIITKPPSAELRDDQKDEDSLPPYDTLDDILRRLVDLEEDVADIIAAGHDGAIVRRIEHLLYISEYKRRQAPPGAKVGSRNFGRDRRYPITNRFRDG